MLERLCGQRPAIIALVNDHFISKAAVTAIKNYNYTFEEQSIVERLVHLLAQGLLKSQQMITQL